MELKGCIPVMVAFTAQHNIHTDLFEFKERFKSAWKFFASGRAWSNFKKRYGVVHYIVVREVTYGENGWHYHQHVLMFIDPTQFCSKVKSDDIQLELTERWIYACHKNNLVAHSGAGLHVSTHKQASSEYLTKLGLAWTETGDLRHELTNASSKKSINIWDILTRAGLDTETDDLGRYERLYLDYVQALSGDNFMTFSHGLNDIIDAHIEKKSKESEDAEQQDEKQEMQDWFAISDYWWRIVVWAKAYHEIIRVASETREADRVIEKLYDLRFRLIRQGKLSPDHFGKMKIRSYKGQLTDGYNPPS
jgi:hypothetical protein